MGRGTLRGRVSSAVLLLVIAGCGSSAIPTVVANPVPTASTVATPGSSPSQTIIAIESPSAGALASPSAAAGHHWTGTEHMVVVFGPGCSVTVDGKLDMVVSDGGPVSGTGTGSFVYLQTGCKGTTITRQQAGVPITGTLSTLQFVLTILFAFGPANLPVTVPLTSSTRAHADGADHPGRAQRTYTLDLSCTDC